MTEKEMKILRIIEIDPKKRMKEKICPGYAHRNMGYVSQRVGLVVLNLLKSSVFSKDICNNIVKYMPSRPNFVVRNVLW